MRRPPRAARDRLFTRARLVRSLAQGLIGLIAVIAVYAVSLWRAAPVDQARASAFTALVLTNIALIFANRAPSGPIRQSLTKPNAWLWALLAATLPLLVCALSVPTVRRTFQFGAPDAIGLGVALAASLAAFAGLMALRVRRTA